MKYSEEFGEVRFRTTVDSESATTTGRYDVLTNPLVSKLPDYYKQFIVDQQYESYTPINHAVWRYYMRQCVNFHDKHAHEAYFDGLARTGLDVEHIPSVEQMNKILARIGWAAVTVDGFIPPAAFMAFQAYRVLVIAADMRQIDHIEYTPSPDIIHEAAGHAPIIADPEYAEYLRRFGEIGSKAMSSKKDFELYEAIRLLSILKETPGTDPAKIEEAEKDVLYKQENLGKPSEMALLSRLHWWTVEYGLVGKIDDFKIYGAGLLSSLGESSRCLSDKVKKIPYSLETSEHAFDITTEQPQLFVVADFKQLLKVLEDFAVGMAFNVGGMSGLNKAVECENVSTAQYSSGLQVSGIFSEVMTDKDNNPAYLKTSSPTSLAFEDRELDGHSNDYHKDGFGAPVGKLKGVSTPLEDLSDPQLAEHNIETGKKCTLQFESGVKVEGTLKSLVRKSDKILLMVFDNCTVTHNDQTLFEPAWGTYDMAVGATVDSVFSGAADKDAYEETSIVSRTRTVKVDYSDSERKLHSLYQKVRDYREGKNPKLDLEALWKDLTSDFPRDWLLSLEILEILHHEDRDKELRAEITKYLEEKAADQKHYRKVITDGLKLADWAPATA
jgi:phenylalanine-4-hydroxylase